MLGLKLNHVSKRGHWQFQTILIMTSSNGNIFRVTGHLCGALMFSLICVWINGWVNNHDAGDLRRYRAHYDVTVMLRFNADLPSQSILSGNFAAVFLKTYLKIIFQRVVFLPASLYHSQILWLNLVWHNWASAISIGIFFYFCYAIFSMTKTLRQHVNSY